MRGCVSIVFLSFALGACKTGSGYEKLKSEQRRPAEIEPGKFKDIQINIGQFSVAPEESTSDTHIRGYFLPGYLGVDFESKGKFKAEAKSRGARNIHDIQNYDELFNNYLKGKGIQTQAQRQSNAGKTVSISGKFIGTETAARMHTYGCWPFVGTFVYIFNGDYMTIISETTIVFEITNAAGQSKQGTTRIITEETFSLYSGLGMMATNGIPKKIGISEKHLNDIHDSLLATLSAQLR